MRQGWTHDGQGQRLDWHLLARLWPFARPHAPALLGGVGLMAGASLAKLAGPYLIKLSIDGPIAHGRFGQLAFYAALFFLAQVLEGALDAAQSLIVRIRGEYVLAALRSELFAKAQRLPSAYLDKTPGGRILSRITSDVAVLSELFSSGMAALVGDLLLLVGILVAMVRLDPVLAAVGCLVLPPLVGVSELFRRHMRVAYRITREKTAVLTGKLNEFLRGVEVLRLFAAEPWADGEFGRANAAHRDAFLRSVTLYALFFPLVELLSALALALLLWQGGGAVLREQVTLGALVAFFEYMQKFFRPVRDLSEKYNVLQASLAAIERIGEFLDLPEEPRGGRRQPRVRGHIAFEGVEFAYDGGPPVLRGIDLEMEPGEVVALVGPTGSGKTTLVHLLMGFYRPDRGAVRIDGAPLESLDLGAFREQVALVPQDVFLFQGSVLDNIRLGRPWVSRERVVEAARTVGLHPAIANLPEGYDTPVLEEGILLSSGQRQLVAFARALAGNPRILLLDEATSEVDQATEALIEGALATLFQGRTSLVVAHRLATVRRADRVVVLKRGEIVEQGTHEGLLARGGLYRTLYELQFRRPAA
ncbi:MAG: ABC transporter ATP-binding protein [Deferrisomatales bacterium]